MSEPEQGWDVLSICIRSTLLSGVLAAISPAQQMTSDVVVQGASLNDGYGGWPTCGVDGRFIGISGGGDLTSGDARIARPRDSGRG